MDALTTIAAVLLDMDGTLVDSDAAVERGWTTWAHEYGLDPAAVLPFMHGSPALVTARRLLPGRDDATLAAAAARQHELQYGDVAGVVPVRGAHRLLQAIEQLELPWAVVTSADRRLARERLGAAGIVPPLLVTIEDTARGKPDPQPYLLAARRLEVLPERCLVVEDSEPGLVAGRAAGALTAALRGLKGDLSLAGLDELTDRLLAARVRAAG